MNEENGKPSEKAYRLFELGGERERVGDKGVKAPLVSQHDESFRFPIYYF